jgi:hypothetical protein
MIYLIKYTYLMQPEKVKEELDRLWKRYNEILENEDSSWEDINEARAILFLTGDVYCEGIAIEAIEKRLPLLKIELSLLEFFDLIDKNKEKPAELIEDELFNKLEDLYKIVKEFKNRDSGGKFYLREEEFLQIYESKNPNQELRSGYKGKWDRKSLEFLNKK